MVMLYDREGVLHAIMERWIMDGWMDGSDTHLGSPLHNTPALDLTLFCFFAFLERNK